MNLRDFKIGMRLRIGFGSILAILVAMVIVTNYLQLLPGGEAKNSYLILGLVLMVAGFVLSTRYH